MSDNVSLSRKRARFARGNVKPTAEVLKLLELFRKEIGTLTMKLQKTIEETGAAVDQGVFQEGIRQLISAKDVLVESAFLPIINDEPITEQELSQ